METSQQDNSQLHSSPLHQKVPNDMGVSSFSRRRESIVLPIILSSLITAAMVGGVMYSIQSNTTQSLNNKIAVLEEKQKMIDSGQASMTDTVVPVLQRDDNTPSTVIPPLQGGQGDVSSTSSLPTNDKGLATNLVTYQDPNIPALRFEYDKSKWEVKTAMNSKDSYDIDVKNLSGRLNIKINGGGRGCAGWSLKKISDKVYGFGTNNTLNIINDNLIRYYLSQENEIGYLFEKVMLRGSSEFTKQMEGCPVPPEKDLIGLGNLMCPSKVSDAFIINCETGPQVFKNEADKKIGKSSFYVSNITYVGSKPEEADEIVKQIKLD
jgi:hypothetical protein